MPMMGILIKIRPIKERKLNMKRRITLLALCALLLASCSQVAGGADDPGYEMISISELRSLLDGGEELTFVNVHIPLEGNIPGTDTEIPFDEIADYQDQLPEDRNAKIVIYCRSGGMGDTASQTLVDLGYTDVSNLEDGYNAWVAAGLPLEE
jgi:rhodanese-related sulfurtransferase